MPPFASYTMMSNVLKPIVLRTKWYYSKLTVLTYMRLKSGSSILMTLLPHGFSETPFQKLYHRWTYLMQELKAVRSVQMLIS